MWKPQGAEACSLYQIIRSVAKVIFWNRRMLGENPCVHEKLDICPLASWPNLAIRTLYSLGESTGKKYQKNIRQKSTSAKWRDGYIWMKSPATSTLYTFQYDRCLSIMGQIKETGYHWNHVTSRLDNLLYNVVDTTSDLSIFQSQ